MARLTHPHALSLIAAAASLAAPSSWAQTLADKPVPAQLDPVTVTSRTASTATVSGWGDIPLAKMPLQATVISSEQLRDAGAQRLADITAIDPAVSDAYNSEGYVDYLTVRGFVLDNRFNFRRDGLPINAEAWIPLENKSRIEVLKGITGMQAGTSAPGGLVNYVVKRPTDAPIHSVLLGWVEPGTVQGSVDLGQRFGVDQAFGIRVNAQAAHLDPMVRSSRGERRLFALAADWRVSPDTLLEAEVETSHRSQPSQPAFSMLGNVVPAPGDPRISLNNQPWSLPVVFDANTASLRWQQKLGGDWRFTAHAATQRLRTDDRLAFPFGCSKEGNYDRYCSDGTFDYYDFESDNERRTTNALQLTLDGKAATGPVQHAFSIGLLSSQFRSRLQPRVDDGVIVGPGTVDGATIIPTLPALGTVSNTNRSERSTEFFARDMVTVTERLSGWLGVRHTRLHRDSIRTDGSEPTDYAQSFTTPWMAVSYAFAPEQLVYASWGRGVESTVAPNRSAFTNAGQALPALQSRQTEVGLKGGMERLQWTIAAFDIQQPQAVNVGACDGTDSSCTTVIDGSARHRGVEASTGWSAGPWTLRGGVQWLHARRENSQTPSSNGLEPTNVPARSLKLQASYDVAALPGLTLQGRLGTTSRRMLLPDNSASIPGYTRVDAGVRYDTRTASAQWLWRMGVDNLFDKRAWRESPYEFSHGYLYPLAPRTLRFSVQVDV